MPSPQAIPPRFVRHEPLYRVHECVFGVLAMESEPVELAQDMRTFDFLSPWEGADYVLPGDEKAEAPDVDKPKVTEKPADTGAGKKAEQKAAEDTPADPPAMDDADKEEDGK